MTLDTLSPREIALVNAAREVDAAHAAMNEPPDGSSTRMVRWLLASERLHEALIPYGLSSSDVNLCEHGGDHEAPPDKRFCSDACLRCEHESESENGCDQICKR